MDYLGRTFIKTGKALTGRRPDRRESFGTDAFGRAFSVRAFHADPHPGNLLFGLGAWFDRLRPGQAGLGKARCAGQVMCPRAAGGSLKNPTASCGIWSRSRSWGIGVVRGTARCGRGAAAVSMWLFDDVGAPAGSSNRNAPKGAGHVPQVVSARFSICRPVFGSNQGPGRASA